MFPTRRLVTATTAAVVLAAGFVAADWNSGRDLYDQRRFDEAAVHFQATVKSNPNWPSGYVMLGRCQLATKQYDEALENLLTAVVLDPDDPTNVVVLSRALMTVERYTESRKLLEELAVEDLSLDWKAEVARMQASCLLEEDRAADAVALLEGRLSDDPDRAALYRAIATAHKASGEFAAAMDDLDRAFTLEPADHSSGRAAVAIALRLAAATEDGDLAARYRGRALDVATRLATVAPEFDHTVLAGQAAFEAGRFDPAAHWFDAAVKSRPQEPRARYDLGRSLAALDRNSEAITELRSALGASPDDELARRIHSQLGHLLTSDLELAAAARHYRAAGKTDRAEQIDEIAAGFAQGLERLTTLRNSTTELAQMEAELESFGDAKGVAALADQRETMDREITAIEDNLSEVQSALSR